MVDPDVRRAQLAAAQRRWRARHPEAARAHTLAWYRKPEVKARKAAAMRAYRAKKREPVDQSTIDNTVST